MRSAEYLLLTIVVLVVAYLIVTPIAAAVGDSFNNTAELIQSAQIRS